MKTHHQLVEEWKEKCIARFGEMDAHVFNFFVEDAMLAAAKGAAEEARLAITKTIEELESRGQLFNGTDSISRQETYTAISQSERKLNDYFKL